MSVVKVPKGYFRAGVLCSFITDLIKMLDELEISSYFIGRDLQACFVYVKGIHTYRR